MKINLKKASLIQEDILKQILELKSLVLLKKDVSISIFENPENILKTAKEKFNDAYDSLINLEKGLYEIRTKVGEENLKSGITSLLSYMNHQNRLMTVYESLKKIDPRKDESILAQKLKRLEESDSGNEFIQEKINSTFLTEIDIEEFEECYEDCRREIRKTKEKLAELNYNNYIELDEETVQILETENMI